MSSDGDTVGCLPSVFQRLKVTFSREAETRANMATIPRRRVQDTKDIEMLLSYWGEMSAEEAKRKLLLVKSGTFLLRKLSSESKSGDSERELYVVSFKRFGNIMNLELLNDGGCYCHGRESHHPRFSSVCELVAHYTNPLSGQRMLQTPLNRVCSLQELCHIVIKQSINDQEIGNLHLPKSVVKLRIT